MKKEFTADILMIVAIALIIAVGPVMWGLYALKAGIALMVLCALIMVAGACMCFSTAFEMTENEEEETKKEERL